MKKITTVITILWISAFFGCGGDQELKKSDLKSNLQKVSYAMGHDIGENVKAQDIEVAVSALLQGIRDGLKDDVTLLTQEEIQAALQGLNSPEEAAEPVLSRADLSQKNKKAGEKFLAENKSKSGVVSLPSGLQYIILSEGEGPSPKPTDRVLTHYIGMLLDGTEFNNSYQTGSPVQFWVSQLTPGWSEALQLMKSGAKWKLFIPSELAYGEAGAGRAIGPNETLIFEVELLSIE